MTPELARFITNTRDTFRRLTFQQLYQLAVSLAAELHDRGVDAEPEARALCAALLAHATSEQRAIFSSDCTEQDCVNADMWAGYYSRQHPARPAPAES